MKALSLAIQKIWPMLEFLKSGSNFTVTRSKILVPIVKVFEKWIKLPGQGHKVKNFGTNRKVLS
jgi:hypothetical protein